MHDAKILLFLKDASNCLLKVFHPTIIVYLSLQQMSVGLMQDQEYNTENFNLFKYNNIYFPDEAYYNTNEFPKVWMEIFDSKKNIVKRT